MLINNQEKLRAQYNPDGSDLRRAQLKMLDMLKFIDRVCQEQGITYWIESGTLLGAARHGGFIPWDDDTDIVMPYEEYLRFREYMLNNNPSDQYVLQCHKTDRHYYGTWGVLRDLKNQYVKNDQRLNSFEYQGLQVDIFPVDQKSRSYTLWRISRWIYAWLVQAPQHGGRFMRYLRWNIPFAYHFLSKAFVPLTHLLTPKDRQSFYYRYGMFWRRKYFKEDIFPLQKIAFENGLFPAPNHVDAYLTECYGDWHQIPPEEKRYNHQFRFKFSDRQE